MTAGRPCRRQFLRAAGVTLALPLLESRGAASPDPAGGPPRRFLATCFALGLHGPNIIPEQSGLGYQTTPHLATLGEDLRDQLTVISGTSHPEVTVGHAGDMCFLTAARRPGAPSFRNSISLDQFLVEKLRPDTRFPSLVLSTRGGSLSYTGTGVQIPAGSKPSALFTKLFVNGSAEEAAEQLRRLEDGQSILDAVLEPARRLQSRVSAPDRRRIEQYFDAVRDVEQRLANGRQWARQPKPRVDYAPPQDIADPNDDVGRLALLLDLVYLAFQTDSTRFVTLYVSGSNAVQPIPGVTMEYHTLSHHGRKPEKLEQLKIIETRQMKAMGRFLHKLGAAEAGGESLLDQTAVLFGSAMGSASSHSCTNLPIVLAGGGFKHGRHLAFDRENNMPLCRLYVSLLQRLGVEADQFATGNGTLAGLEML